MKIVLERNSQKSDIDFLTKKINEETDQYGQADPFAFFVRDNEEKIIAGANGFILYGTIHIDQLWVDKKYRKKGLGRKIMDQIHDLGRSEGCNIASVQTMSFQNAVNFYQKLGYILDFKRFDYIKDSCCIFMKKNLQHFQQI